MLADPESIRTQMSRAAGLRAERRRSENSEFDLAGPKEIGNGCGSASATLQSKGTDVYVETET